MADAGGLNYCSAGFLMYESVLSYYKVAIYMEDALVNIQSLGTEHSVRMNKNENG